MQTTTTPKPPHLFTGCEGHLFDTRRADWPAHPLRERFSGHRREIESGRDLCACLRAGEMAWPGAYAIAYITSDSGALCPGCVRENLASVLWSIRNKTSDGWRVVGLTHAGEWDEEEFCGHCSNEI